MAYFKNRGGIVFSHFNPEDPKVKERVANGELIPVETPIKKEINLSEVTEKKEESPIKEGEEKGASEDKGLDELKEEAKKLGIRGAHLVKNPEVLKEKIENHKLL